MASTEHRLNDSLIQRVNVGDFLTRSAARAPDRVALSDGGRRIGFRQFNKWVNRTAHGLAAIGYGRGDSIALMSGNSAEFLVTYFACAKLGAVCVPLNLFWRGGELAYVLEDAGVRCAVVERGLLEQFLSGVEEDSALRDLVVIEEGERGDACPSQLRARVHRFDDL